MKFTRAYRTLLRLYPEDYKAMFSAEMLNAFEKATEERRAQGGLILVRFILAELAGLIIGAGVEWIAKLTTDKALRGQCLPDLRMMRPPGVPHEVWFASACMSSGQSVAMDEMIEAKEKIAVLIRGMVHAIANHDFPGARSYSYQERETREHLRLLEEKYTGSRG
jgi:hypothetical protein